MRDGLAESRHDEEPPAGPRGGQPMLGREEGRREGSTPQPPPACLAGRGRCGMEGKGHASGVTLGQSPRMLSRRRIAARGGGARTGEVGRGGACALPQADLHWRRAPAPPSPARCAERTVATERKPELPLQLRTAASGVTVNDEVKSPKFSMIRKEYQKKKERSSLLSDDKRQIIVEEAKIQGMPSHHILAKTIVYIFPCSKHYNECDREV
ncbi:hypothetical protein HPG69_018354 [Diceros bicornis minor]|uniref:Uncharacterized protein n=1 Tax=Diceros bicornis minor TaxID=77932 RepID=A0A7J7FGI8_DICBM|nr:hypothetical protein HPG69_018354 [Diceros bicornis minor]